MDSMRRQPLELEPVIASSCLDRIALSVFTNSGEAVPVFSSMSSCSRALRVIRFAIHFRSKPSFD